MLKRLALISPTSSVCTQFYEPQWDRSIAWNDPDIGIDWPLEGLVPQLSAKDVSAVGFKDAEVFV